eukprot:7283939-Prymnesium_polylepis.2
MSYADGSSFLSLSVPRPAASSLSDVSRISLTGRPLVPMIHFSSCPMNATNTAIHEQRIVFARRACETAQGTAQRAVARKEKGQAREEGEGQWGRVSALE